MPPVSRVGCLTECVASRIPDDSVHLRTLCLSVTLRSHLTADGACPASAVATVSRADILDALPSTSSLAILAHEVVSVSADAWPNACGAYLRIDATPQPIDGITSERYVPLVDEPTIILDDDEGGAVVQFGALVTAGECDVRYVCPSASREGLGYLEYLAYSARTSTALPPENTRARAFYDEIARFHSACTSQGAGYVHISPSATAGVLTEEAFAHALARYVKQNGLHVAHASLVLRDRHLHGGGTALAVRLEFDASWRRLAEECHRGDRFGATFLIRLVCAELSDTCAS